MVTCFNQGIPVHTATGKGGGDAIGSSTLIAFDLTQAERFITALTGSPDTRVVFQLADDVPEGVAKRDELTRVLEGTAREHAIVLERLNAMGCAIWMQVNAGRRGIKNVTGLRACFVDDDGKGEPPVLTLQPSISVHTSAGERNRHFYWVLEPGEAIERFVPTQKQLIKVLGTDKSICNIDRVMRLPGTYNMKRANTHRGEPEPVTLLHTDGRRFTLDQLVAAYPLPAAEETELSNEPQPEIFTPAALAAAQRVYQWLTDREITHRRQSPISFVLERCVFNPAHIQKMAIKILPRGGVWCGCFHDSCGGNINRWAAVKDRVGGWRSPSGFSRGDDVEIAARLLADIGAELPEPIVQEAEKLWKYSTETGLWAQIPEDELGRQIMSYAGSPIGEKRRLNINGGTLRGVLTCARASAAAPGFFSGAESGIAFANGFLLATPAGATFTGHSPEHRQCAGLPFDYSDRAWPGRWLTYLVECFQDDPDSAAKIDLLQEFLGACLVGAAPRYEKALMLDGEGSNGKSVFIKVAYALFPPTMRTAVKPQDFGSEYARARLFGSRVNLVSEVPESEILSSDAFKAIITGEPIEARQPYGRLFSYCATAGHIFAANRLPATADHSHGFWRRFLVIRWNRIFDEDRKERGLAERLIATEMPGIAAWAARGAARLLARGAYAEPASAITARETWQLDSDQVASFLRDCTMPGDAAQQNGETQASTLYSAFREWLDKNGHKVMTSTAFGRRLRARGVISRIGGLERTVRYPVVLTVAPPLQW